MGNFFSGIAQTAVKAAPFAAQVVAQREAKEKADRAAALAQLRAQSQDNTASVLANIRAGEGLANIGKLNAETTKLQQPTPKRTYDPIRGVMVDEAAGTASPIAGLPDRPTPPRARGNIDPLSPEGIAAGASRAGAVAKAEAPFKKDPNAPPVQRPRQPSEFANKAALIYQRAADAATRLEPFYQRGAPIKAGAGKIPVIGNYVLSPEEQVMNQAAETVASAILRLESGAAISESEVKSYAKQFLPQPGDSPEVRADKHQTLQTQLERIKAAAGPAMADSPTPAPPGRGRGGPPPSTPRGGAKHGITPEERAALKSKGFSDQQITAKYGPP